MNILQGGKPTEIFLAKLANDHPKLEERSPDEKDEEEGEKKTRGSLWRQEGPCHGGPRCAKLRHGPPRCATVRHGASTNPLTLTYHDQIASVKLFKFYN